MLQPVSLGDTVAGLHHFRHLLMRDVGHALLVDLLQVIFYCLSLTLWITAKVLKQNTVARHTTHEQRTFLIVSLISRRVEPFLYFRGKFKIYHITESK